MSFSFPTTQVEQAATIREVYRWMARKKSTSYAAERIGITETDYLVLRDQIQEVLDEYNIDSLTEDFLVTAITTTSPSNFSPAVSTGIAQTELSENVEKGEQTIKVLSNTRPRTAEEVVELLQIDTTQWTLKQYWNKEKNGRWEISALVGKKDPAQLTVVDIDRLLYETFDKMKFSTFHLVPKMGNGRALFIYATDKHVGADVSKVAMFGNAYSAAIYRERMEKVFAEIGYLVGMCGRFEKIFYVDLGDHTDGQDGKTVSKSHSLPQNLSNRETFDTCLAVELDFLNDLFTSDYASSYEVIQNANSNHSGDFDYYVSRAVELYCNLRFPDIKTRVLEKFIEHVEYGSHTILLCHGKDDGDMKHGLPKALNDKTENYIRRYLQHKQIDVTERTVTFAKGDLHQSASEQVYGLRYRNAASLFGSSKWIQTNFGPGSPGCSYDIFDSVSSRVLEGTIHF